MVKNTEKNNDLNDIVKRLCDVIIDVKDKYPDISFAAAVSLEEMDGDSLFLPTAIGGAVRAKDSPTGLLLIHQILATLSEKTGDSSVMLAKVLYKSEKETEKEEKELSHRITKMMGSVPSAEEFLTLSRKEKLKALRTLGEALEVLINDDEEED